MRRARASTGRCNNSRNVSDRIQRPVNTAQPPLSQPRLYPAEVRFELVRSRLEALPRELPAAPAVLTPVRLDSPDAWVPHDPNGRGRPSAVLVLLFPDAEGEARVLLTARQSNLASHAGEVSFPGGRADESDADPIATALREAAEEVGLDPVACGLRVVGGLEVFALTVSGYRITPVVALAERRPECRPAPDEVARIVEAPVEAFLPDAPVELEERTIRERLIRYGVYPVEGERVWGATARMLGQLGAALAVERDAGAPRGDALRADGRPAPDEDPLRRHHPLRSRLGVGDDEWWIRRAEEPDDSSVIAFLGPLRPELARPTPARADGWFIAETPNRLAGIATWAPWQRHRDERERRGFDGLELPDDHTAAEITLLVVRPDMRGRGIGRGLVEALARSAREAGATRLLAWTPGDSDIHPASIAARSFFRSNGFADVAVDRRIRAHGEDRLLLSLPLGEALPRERGVAGRIRRSTVDEGREPGR
jgi:8-oxo-dGTP pyrophosphatase MutT (NUDIX family)/GNAT superfamily N-acetyltransferase